MMSSYGKTAYCPECNGKVTLKKRPRLGQVVTCRHCDTRLEVIEVMPLELDWAFEDSSYEDERDTFDYDFADLTLDEYDDF
jgi:lysine biosynthesis protein LysW